MMPTESIVNLRVGDHVMDFLRISTVVLWLTSSEIGLLLLVCGLSFVNMCISILI